MADAEAAELCGKDLCGGARRSDHATPFITQLKWLKIDKKVISDVAVTVFKVKNRVFPDWFIYLPTNNDLSLNIYTTRQLHNLYVSHTNTECGGPSLTPRYGTPYHARSRTLQIYRHSEPD